MEFGSKKYIKQVLRRVFYILAIFLFGFSTFISNIYIILANSGTAVSPTVSLLDGELDLTFDPESNFSGHVYSLAVQSGDEKILAGGTFNFNSTSINRIGRMETDGSQDLSFDPGTGADNGIIYALAVQPSDSKIIVAGSFTSFNGSSINRIIRLNTDGSQDMSFDPGTGFDGTVLTLTLDANEKILAGGNFTAFDGTNIDNIARLNTDGSLDVTFSPYVDFSGTVYSVAVQLSDQKIVAGGNFTTDNNLTTVRITRFNTDGSQDMSFDPGTGFDSAVLALALDVDEKIIAAGNFTDYDGTGRNRIVRINTDGSIDATFDPGTGFDAQVNTITIQPSDEKIIAGGTFNTYDGTGRSRIVRINTDGTLDTDFDPGTGFEAFSAVISIISQLSDEKVIAGGSFIFYDGTIRVKAARIYTSGNSYNYDASAFTDPFTFNKVILDVNGTPTVIYDDIPLSHTKDTFADWLEGELGDTVTYDPDSWSIYNSVTGDTYGDLTIFISTVPSVPLGPTVAPGNERVTLRWSSPSDNGGASIDYYQFEISLDGSTWTDTGVTVDGNTFSHQFTGLTNGTTYYFHVLAHNVIGNGPYTDALSAIPERPSSGSGGGNTDACPLLDGFQPDTSYCPPVTNTCATNPSLCVNNPPVVGCMDPTATNFNSKANKDTNPSSCMYNVVICQDQNANNYRQSGSCKYNQTTCQNPLASNIGSPLPCIFLETTCQDNNANNFGQQGACTYDQIQPFCVTNPTDPSCVSPIYPGGSGDTTSFVKDTYKAMGQTPKILSLSGLLAGILSMFIAFISLNSLSISDIALLPFRLWNLLLSVLGLRKKYPPWGRVYDSVTKQPLDPVIVTLYDNNDKEISTAITDMDGRYGFLVAKGTYRIEPKKTHYLFASKRLAGKTKDELYSDLYFGEFFEVKNDNEVLTKNIPMDPLNFDWNEFAKRDQKLMRFYSKRDFVLERISSILFTVGAFMSLVSLILVPNTFNKIVFGLYVIMYLLQIFGFSPHKLGYVEEKYTGNPLSFAVLHLINKATGFEISKKVANANGRFYCLAQNGEYTVKVDKKNIDMSYSPAGEKNVVISNGILRGKVDI